MNVVTAWTVPPSRSSPPVADLSTQYRETMQAGISPFGQVHPARFWRLAELADPYVFRGGRVPTSRITASIMLLWDFSSSQRGYRPELIHSLDAIGSALRHLKTPLWAGAYTNEKSDCDIFQVCGFHERWDSRRVATLIEVHMNGTPTGLALEWVRAAVVPQAPTRRRLLVVCTDGEPDDVGYQNNEIAILKSLGVVVCGLYVGTGANRMTLARQYGERYAFGCPRREDIPQAFDEILLRIRG